RHRQVDVAECRLGEHTPARGALDEPLLQQIGLDDLLDHVALVAKRRRHRLDPDRAAAVILGDAAQVAAVEPIQSAAVDIEPQQRGVGALGIDLRPSLHGREVADAAQEAHRSARRAAGAAGDLAGAVAPQVEGEDARAAADDQRQLGRLVEDEAERDAEALAQRPGNEPGPRRRADQGEFRQIDPHRAGARPLADDQVELKILHRRVENFLDRRGKAMDLVDKQEVARLEVREQGGEVAGALDDRAGRGAEPDPELARDDLRERRLAEPGRTEKQHVVQRFPAPLRRLDKDAEVIAELPLADELVEAERPDRGLGRILRGLLRRDHPRLAHRLSACKPAAISASTLAPCPSWRAAALTAPNASARPNFRFSSAETASATAASTAPGGGAAPGAAGARARPPTLFCSSLTMRTARRGPTPSARTSTAWS